MGVHERMRWIMEQGGCQRRDAGSSAPWLLLLLLLLGTRL